MDSRIIQALETTVAAVAPDRAERIAVLQAILDRLGAVEPEPQEKLLTTSEACAAVGCTPKTLRNWESRGLVKAFRVTARRVRWSLAGYRSALGEGKGVQNV